MNSSGHNIILSSNFSIFFFSSNISSNSFYNFLFNFYAHLNETSYLLKPPLLRTFSLKKLILRLGKRIHNVCILLAYAKSMYILALLTMPNQYNISDRLLLFGSWKIFVIFLLHCLFCNVCINLSCVDRFMPKQHLNRA